MADTLKASPGGRSRARASALATNNSGDDRDQQFDLLTAALLGAAVGAAVTLLFRTGPSGRRPISPMLSAAGRGARFAGMAGLQGARWAGEQAAPGAQWMAEQGAEGARWAGKRTARGYRAARDRGSEIVDDLPIDDMTESVREYVDSAREAINNVVREEMSDLRKAVRRQRKRIGI
jgi:gas vesicle protein